jgi:hypothetical protein
MSETTFRKYYAQTEFTAMAGEFVHAEQFALYLTTLPLGLPAVDVRAVQTHSVSVEWDDFPPPGDIAIVDAAVAAFVALPPTDEPLQAESLGITSATTSTLVDVIDVTTPPRDAGTYQVLWDCLVGMLATVANAGVRGLITLTRTQGSSVVTRQWEHNWNLQQPQTFSGGITFECEAGATIRARLQVAKIGAPAATAQMSVARITADKIG